MKELEEIIELGKYEIVVGQDTSIAFRTRGMERSNID